MNIQHVRIFGKDDIDSYRNAHAPNNGMINVNAIVSFSRSEKEAFGRPKKWQNWFNKIK